MWCCVFLNLDMKNYFYWTSLGRFLVVRFGSTAWHPKKWASETYCSSQRLGLWGQKTTKLRTWLEKFPAITLFECLNMHCIIGNTRTRIRIRHLRFKEIPLLLDYKTSVPRIFFLGHCIRDHYIVLCTTLNHLRYHFFSHLIVWLISKLSVLSLEKIYKFKNSTLVGCN